MPTREEIIDAITKKCEDKLNYYDVVNESAEMVEFRMIVEFILDTVFGVWSDK